MHPHRTRNYNRTVKKHMFKRWIHRALSAMAFAFLLVGAASFASAQSSDEVTPEVQQLYAQAKAAQQRGDTATAIEKYRAMIKLAPHLAAAYNNLGMLYFNEHDYANAAEVLKRGLELHRGHADCFRDAGDELLPAGRQ